MTARVGRKAPDFNAPAYYRGSFENVQLSDHFGKWTLLCFYPGPDLVGNVWKVWKPTE